MYNDEKMINELKTNGIIGYSFSLNSIDKKNKTYEKYVYKVIRVWRSDFLDNENKVVKDISNILLENF